MEMEVPASEQTVNKIMEKYMSTAETILTVKLVRCSKPTLWYRGQIGKTFKVFSTKFQHSDKSGEYYIRYTEPFESTGLQAFNVCDIMVIEDFKIDEGLFEL